MRRILLLGGFMGTGKSTVGRLVADRAGVPFVDLDVCIEQRAGASVATIFHDQGEAVFRSLERAELERTLADPSPRVVALGGGALLNRTARLRALDLAVVVTLEAPIDEIVRRVGLHGGRPLLAVPDPSSRIAELLELRRIPYAEAAARVDTANQTPDEVANRVLEVWQRDPVVVAAGDRSYGVEIGSGIVAERLSALVGEASLGLVVTDSNVAPLYGDAIETTLARSGPAPRRVVLEPGETHKTLASLERVWRAAAQANADRRSVIIALGGGVVSDVAGFAAATWMRGIRWVSLPTTLLSMVDASVGGKTAIDLGSAKNSVGAFWQPCGVLCDVTYAASEPARGYRSALAEVIKSALIGDPGLFELLEAEVEGARNRDPDLIARLVARSVRVKARVVGQDERESGVRATLNLGHTVGHALEAQTGYTRLTHGEAVSLGLVAALAIGEQLSLTPRHVRERTEHLLDALGLPTSLADYPLAEASGLIGHDKKRSGPLLGFVVARELGQVCKVDLALSEVRRRVASLA